MCARPVGKQAWLLQFGLPSLAEYILYSFLLISQPAGVTKCHSELFELHCCPSHPTPRHKMAVDALFSPRDQWSLIWNSRGSCCRMPAPFLCSACPCCSSAPLLIMFFSHSSSSSSASSSDSYTSKAKVLSPSLRYGIFKTVLLTVLLLIFLEACLKIENFIW